MFYFFKKRQTSYSHAFVCLSVACALCIKKNNIPNQGLEHRLPFFQASAITIGTFKPATLLGRNCNIYKMKQTGETESGEPSHHPYYATVMTVFILSSLNYAQTVPINQYRK